MSFKYAKQFLAQSVDFLGSYSDFSQLHAKMLIFQLFPVKRKPFLIQTPQLKHFAMKNAPNPVRNTVNVIDLLSDHYFVIFRLICSVKKVEKVEK